MTTPTTNPVIVHATNCWSSFTKGCSIALQKLAAAVTAIWAMIKNACVSLYKAAVPLVSKAMLWAKANQQTAMIGGGVTALALAAGAYFCFFKKAAAPENKDQKPAEQKAATV